MIGFDSQSTSRSFFASLLCLIGCACTEQASDGEVDAATSHLSRAILSDDELQWETRSSGVEVAVLYGDPEQAGPFGQRLKYPPGYAKKPHYHPNDAFVTVLSGAYHRSYGTTLDRSGGVRLTAGTFSLNPAGVSHHEWVDEPAELEVHAVGPWATVYVQEDGQPVEAGQAQLVPARPPVVLRPEELMWKVRPGGDEIAVLHGDPATPGPFVLRIRSVAGNREQPHEHPRDAYVTILSGGFRYEAGGRLVMSDASPVSAGDILKIGAGTPHFKWNEGPSLVEVHGVGPWETTWLHK